MASSGQHLQHHMQPQGHMQTHAEASPPLRQLPQQARSQQAEAGPSSWDHQGQNRNPSLGGDQSAYTQPTGPATAQPGNYTVPYGQQGGYYPTHPGQTPGYAPAPLPLDYQLSQLQNQVYEEFHLRLYPLLRQHGDLIRDLDGRLYASETRAAAGLERISELEAKVAELQGGRSAPPHHLPPPLPLPVHMPAHAPAPALAPAPLSAALSASASSSTSVLKRKKTVQAAASGSKKGGASKASKVREELPPAVWEEVQAQVAAATAHLYGVPRPYPYWHELAAGEEWPRLRAEDGVSEGIKAIRFDYDETVSGPHNQVAFRAIVRFIVDNKRLHPAGLNMGPGSLVQAKGVLLEAAHKHFEELKDSW